MSTRVNVIMSVHNGERYLNESIESILSQTFADYEFIIIDDGSTDDTWQILQDYAARDARIVLVRSEANIGLARSLNKDWNCSRVSTPKINRSNGFAKCRSIGNGS